MNHTRLSITDVTAVLESFEKSGNTLDAFDDEYYDWNKLYVGSGADDTVIEWQTHVREYCNTHAREYNTLVVIEALNLAAELRKKPYWFMIREEDGQYLIKVVPHVPLFDSQ